MNNRPKYDNASKRDERAKLDCQIARGIMKEAEKTKNVTIHNSLDALFGKSKRIKYKPVIWEDK